jgi:hypothetical protein
MMQSTDDEIAQVIERLSWSPDDLVVILFSRVGLPTLFMDRGFRFCELRATLKTFQLDDPITANMIRGWRQRPNEKVHGIVVQSFHSQDGVLFEPYEE